MGVGDGRMILQGEGDGTRDILHVRKTLNDYEHAKSTNKIMINFVLTINTVIGFKKRQPRTSLVYTLLNFIRLAACDSRILSDI